MEQKKIFISRKDFQEAEFKALLAGYRPIGRSLNPRGEFVVFARKGYTGKWMI